MIARSCPHASLMSGTRMGNRNRVFNGAVIAAEPQDFFYKGGDTIAVIGDDNVIRENVVINRSSTAEGRTSIGNGNFLHEGYMFLMIRIGNRSVFGYGSKISGNCILKIMLIFEANVLMSQGSRVVGLAMIQTGCRFRKDIPLLYREAAQEPTTYYGVNSFIMSHQGFRKVIKHHSVMRTGSSSKETAALRMPC